MKTSSVVRVPSDKPINLAKRTALNPMQLKRVEGGAGHGLRSKYDKNGKQDLELTRRLAKAKAKAKRYGLFTDQIGRRLYIADPRLIKLGKKEVPLTFNRKEALQFYFGFDDPEKNIAFYNGMFIWKTFNF